VKSENTDLASSEAKFTLIMTSVRCLDESQK